MKIKTFDFKLPDEDKKKKKMLLTAVSATVLILIIMIASTFAYYQSLETQNPVNSEVGLFSNGDIIFAVTIDGVPSQTFPTSGSGYVASSVTCDKGATGIWDNNSWTIVVSNLTQSKTTCNIFFSDVSENLVYKILQQGGGENVIEAKGDPVFNAIPTAATSGLYAAEDEYGTSYYYRGERESLSNNLIFAGFQWKIVRINGDGSIRIIYNGTEAHFNSLSTMNTTGTDTQIGTSYYSQLYDFNRYVGYMRGSAYDTYANSHKNEINSTVKIVVDNWYGNNIANKSSGITSKIADNLFCNDRELLAGGGFSVDDTYYKGYQRLSSTASPTLKCAQKNDRFTVNDTAKGNGSLTYPVGIISADEVAYSGLTYTHYNSSQYMYTGYRYWTMTPYRFINSSYKASVFEVNGNGYIYFSGVDFAFPGVRPVLNLKSDVKVSSGVGSTTDPYIIL